jgi:hypothetical protein
LSAHSDLIYDWNAPERGPAEQRSFSPLDDTLRDGPKSTVVRQPSLGERAELPSASVGRVQEVCVGPLSGRANVEAWLAGRGLAPGEELLRRILERARAADHVLSDEELGRMVDR